MHSPCECVVSFRVQRLASALLFIKSTSFLLSVYLFYSFTIHKTDPDSFVILNGAKRNEVPKA